MSTRKLTVELPVSAFQQLADLAKLKQQSIEQVAAQTITNNLLFDQKRIIKRDEVLAIIAAHREQLQAMGVKSLDLFGSVARDEANPDSDIDFLVEFDRSVGYFRYFEVKHYLEDILSCPVDLGTQDSLKEHLRELVLEELIHAL